MLGKFFKKANPDQHFELNGSGCTDDASVTVAAHPGFSVEISATAGEICQGQNSILSKSYNGGASPILHVWTGGSTAATLTVTPSASTTYNITATDANGCTATDSQPIVVNAITFLPTVSPATACPGVARTISAGATGSEPITYQWSGGLPNAASHSVSPMVSTVYFVTATESHGCTKTTSFNVPVFQNTLNGVPSGLVCPGTAVNLSMTYGLASGSWSTGATTQSISVNPSTTTTYTVSGTDVNGCPVNFSGTVQVHNLPPMSAAAPTLPVDGNNSVITPITFTWLPGNNATSYELFVWPSSQPRPASGSPTSNISLIVNTLAANTQFNWQVKSLNVCNFVFSDTAYFSTNYPDLVVDSIAAPMTVFTNTPFAVTWRVKNTSTMAGTGTTTWNDQIYLSFDTILNTAFDISLGSFGNLSYLPFGGSYVQVKNVNATNVIGNFYLLIKADVNNNIPETDNNNNLAHSQLPPLAGY